MTIPALQTCECGHRGFEHDPQTTDCLHTHCQCDSYQHVSYQPPLARGQARRSQGRGYSRQQMGTHDERLRE